jgi:VIT1/CCC1 family predicted Fe2+/Mn2+ transporter
MEELKNWREEKRSVYLYEVLAQKEAGTSFANLFSQLAKEAAKQASLWEELIRKKGGILPEQYKPDLRTQLVAIFLKKFGPKPLRTILSAMKVRGMSVYSPEIRTGHPVPSNIEEVGRRHRGIGGGNILRAAVFGINDGLVSNASLILGIAGASTHNSIILLTGIAGLLAGAFSMAAGEYISVRSQREMFEYQIGLEKNELNEYPQEEAAELALIYEAKGLSQEEAKTLANKLIADPAQALDTLAREELGLNPQELGSPWGAAIFSFLSFAGGALVPLFPFFFPHGTTNLWISITLTATTLFLVGATLSLFTGRSALKGGLRMLLIGGVAGAATFTIGKFLGVSLG